MKIVVYGLSITSSWGNGHATTYRALLKAFAARGHRVVFVEKDVAWYREHRDLAAPAYCAVTLYADWQSEEAGLVALSADADAVIVGSYFADAVEATEALLTHVRCPVLFYDIDTPITMRALRTAGAAQYLRASAIAYYAAYLSFTGGPTLVELEQQFGARKAIGFYCSVDAAMYRPTAPQAELACDLSYLGTYAQDRQAKLLELLNKPAQLQPARGFLVAGPQYPPDAPWAPNVMRLEHLPPAAHPAFYTSSRFTLNLTRQDMVAAGYSPSVRLFEASACGAAIVSDEWPGLAELLTPNDEILLATTGEQVAAILQNTTDEARLRMGARARERILAEHTATRRALELENILAACRA